MPKGLPSHQIRALHERLRAPPEQYAQLESVLSYLRSEIQPRIKASAVREFGSCSNGLWTSASDADLTLIVPRCNNKMKIVSRLKATRDFVRKTAPFSIKSMDIVENARIPVLKLRLQNEGFSELDVSINNVSGIENSMLVKQWAIFNPAFVPLAFAVKHWAKLRGINDRAKGTLSTYTLLLQLVFVMQQRGLLPRFNEFSHPAILEQPFEELNGYLRPLPFDQSLPFQRREEETGSVLAAFFETFGAQAMADGSEIVDGQIVSAPTQTGALVMRCPLTGKDVNILSGSAWKSIHTEFSRAHRAIESGSDFDSLISPKEE